jgi:ATP-dependent Clp protease ATP-binding subunit ClpA
MVPKINVYLPDELAEAVKEAGIPVSAVCQRALEQAVARITAIKELVIGDGSDLRTDLEGSTARFSRFTNRARNVIALAMDEAETGHVAIATEHVLGGILAEGGNLALSVLRSMDIGPEEIAAAITARRTHDTGTAADATFDEPSQDALRLAVTEATSFGHNYVGCEHLLLGLIAEPNGVAGQILRGLGADLRLTRRAVAGALAGYTYVQANTAGKATGAPSPATVTALADAIQQQLAPIVARLERLENAQN